jgi:hypothetical protein
VPTCGAPPCERIDIEPSLERGFHIRDSIRQRERHFLHGSGACFADVITRDRDRIPIWNFLRAKRKYIGDESHGWRRRENVRAARHVLFENVVLDGAAQLVHIRALTLRHRNVHRQQNARRRVDGHRSRNFVQRNLVEQLLHIADGRNRNAHLAHFALRDRIIRIVPNLGW